MRHIDRIRQRLPRSRLVVVSNHQDIQKPEIHLDRDSDDIFHCHDNSGLEFGAYEAGLRILCQAGGHEWTIIANDTFAVHRPFGPTARAIVVDTVTARVEGAAISGRVEALPASYTMAGMRTHRWVTTNLFALNRAAVGTLDGRLYSPEIDSWATAVPDEERFFSPSVAPVLRDHLCAWLFGSLPGPRWYASASLNKTNSERLALKARAILQEKYLAARLEAAGASFLNWKEQPFGRLFRLKLEERVLRMWHGIP